MTEYARNSGGKLKLEVLDPEPFSEIEERALQYGLKGIPVGTANELLYFGLAGTNSTDDEEIIPFFQPDKENLLEYDLSKLVYTLSDPKKVVVGVMTTLPMEGSMPDPTFRTMPEPWIVMDQIRQFFEVQTVATTVTEIPEDVEVLMIVHPKGLSEDTLFAIDQFVLRGGKAMVFVDSFCEEDQPITDPSNPLAGMQADRSSSLGPVMEAWGLKLADGVFAAAGAYTLVGRIPFVSKKLSAPGIELMVRGDPRLRRPYLVEVSPAAPEAARDLAAFLRQRQVQDMLATFGKGRYDDQPLFFPVVIAN